LIVLRGSHFPGSSSRFSYSFMSKERNLKRAAGAVGAALAVVAAIAVF